MVRNLQGAFLDPGAQRQQKTDFAELAGTYTIKSGILSNQDLELKSPLLRVAGKGTVDLPQQTVNYRVEPKAVASTTGQGGASEASGIMVPVIIEGPWSNLSYKPDLAAAVGGVARERALEQLQRAVPGGGATGTQGAPAPGQPASPTDTLRRMLGR
jgi:AsmA protein